jgi:hypothetical protein
MRTIMAVTIMAMTIMAMTIIMKNQTYNRFFRTTWTSTQ